MDTKTNNTKQSKIKATQSKAKAQQNKNRKQGSPKQKPKNKLSINKIHTCRRKQSTAKHK